MLGNYHTHCNFCDGKGEAEDYILEAIKKNFDSIGISSHGPFPMEENTILSKANMGKEDLKRYMDTIQNLKNKYRDKIEVYLGIEVEYIEGTDVWEYLNIKRSNFDYILGAIHYVPSKAGFLCVDGSKDEMKKLISIGFNNDSSAMVKEYYRLYAKMCKDIKPDIGAHIDLVKKLNLNNKYFNSNDEYYDLAVDKAIKAAKENDIILETNSGAMSRGYKNVLYPSDKILAKCKNLNIPFVISADAHEAKNIDYKFRLMRDKLKNAGYNKTMQLQKNKWIEVDI